MGAFADRHVIYQLTADHATFSVTSGTPVVFVLVPSSGIEFTTPAGIDADIHNLRRVLGARILVSSPCDRPSMDASARGQQSAASRSRNKLKVFMVVVPRAPKFDLDR